MSIMGGGSKDNDKKVVKPAGPVYYGNPQNGDLSRAPYRPDGSLISQAGFSTSQGDKFTPKQKKPSLMSGGLK